jgi:hypothetical protein
MSLRTTPSIPATSSRGQRALLVLDGAYDLEAFVPQGVGEATL